MEDEEFVYHVHTRLLTVWKPTFPYIIQRYQSYAVFCGKEIVEFHIFRFPNFYGSWKFEWNMYFLFLLPDILYCVWWCESFLATYLILVDANLIFDKISVK